MSAYAVEVPSVTGSGVVRVQAAASGRVVVRIVGNSQVTLDEQGRQRLGGALNLVAAAAVQDQKGAQP